MSAIIRKFTCVFVFITVLVTGPKTIDAQNLFVKTIDHYLITCFPSTAVDSAGNGYTCEASAVLYYDKTVYVGSDRDFPGTSAMFTIPFSIPLANHGTDVKVVNQAVINNARKWEDMSIDPERRFIFAITGFDRVKAGSHEWDNFNVLSYWPVGLIDSASILCETDSGGVKSSLLLRHRISKVLADTSFPQGMPYFKTEALCVLPENRLLFGIREYGKDYSHFDYAFRILQCSYQVKDEQIILNDDFKDIYNPGTLFAAGNPNPLALSSMEYDPLTDRIWFLTSYEDNNTDPPTVGSYLWYLPLRNFEAGMKPIPARDTLGLHQHFSHKAEGITVVNSSTLLIICDDDRALLPLETEGDQIRQKNQSAYYLLEVISGQ